MSSKVVFVIFLALCSQFAIADEEEPVDVQILNGTSAKISADEVRRAYVVLHQRISKNAQAFIPNEDGSVAIIVPRFRYADKNMRIDDNYSSSKGACKRFGFETMVGKEEELVLGSVPVAVLGEDGKLKELLPVYDDGELVKHSVLKSVGCR